MSSKNTRSSFSRAPTKAALAVAVAALVVLTGLAAYVARLDGRVAELERQLADADISRRESSPPAAAAAPAAPAPTGPVLDAAQREAMLARLRTEVSNPDLQVWFAVPGNAEALSYQRSIAGVFEEAGWTIRGTQRVGFPVKAGIYLFVAEQDEPPYVATVVDAFRAAGIEPNVGLGYRSYYEEKKKENPDWNGFSMTPDQTNVVVVGPPPAS